MSIMKHREEHSQISTSRDAVVSVIKHLDAAGSVVRRVMRVVLPTGSLEFEFSEVDAVKLAEMLS